MKKPRAGHDVVREVLREAETETGRCPLCGRTDPETASTIKLIRNPDDVVRLAAVQRIAREHREHFLVVILDARHQVKLVHTVSIGSLNASIVHPREVFRPALLWAAASIVLVHNHPSGDTNPSEEDISITKRLVEVGDTLGISVLDHVIVGRGGRSTYSFRASNLL